MFVLGETETGPCKDKGMVQGITCMVAQLMPRTGTHKLLWSLNDILVTSTKSCQGLVPLTFCRSVQCTSGSFSFHLVFHYVPNFVFFPFHSIVGDIGTKDSLVDVKKIHITQNKRWIDVSGYNENCNILFLVVALYEI